MQGQMSFFIILYRFLKRKAYNLRNYLLHSSQDRFDGRRCADSLRHPLFGREATETVDTSVLGSESLRRVVVRQVLLQLELHNMPQRIIGQVHRRIDHMAVNRQQDAVMLA